MNHAGMHILGTDNSPAPEPRVSREFGSLALSKRRQLGISHQQLAGTVASTPATLKRMEESGTLPGRRTVRLLCDTLIINLERAERLTGYELRRRRRPEVAAALAGPVREVEFVP